MLARCNAEGGGVHFVGDSSTGKTTLLEAGCSVWGGPNYRRSWRATANGMEGAAALFNDCLLALDEISECDPREVGAIVYSLGNGRGKQRAGRSGNARGVTRWRCFILSSGERSIATTMLKADTGPRPGKRCDCWIYQRRGRSALGTTCTTGRAVRPFRMRSSGHR
jgi:putative DNA primase/helicase